MDGAFTTEGLIVSVRAIVEALMGIIEKGTAGGAEPLGIVMIMAIPRNHDLNRIVFLLETLA
jgi:hypothetical protein